jgi:hypothetical protein
MAHFIAFSHTDIHEEAVQSYIREGGEVANLLNDVSRGVKVYSVAYISAGHVRSGRLLRSLWWNRSKLEGPLQGVARAGASAKHAIWFHEGTAGGGAGYIAGHPHMVVPKSRKAAHTNIAFSGAGAQKLAEWGSRSTKQQAQGKGVFRADLVRGQRSKPFLKEGLAASMAAQRL